jgi:hypothetical protein
MSESTKLPAMLTRAAVSLYTDFTSMGLLIYSLDTSNKAFDENFDTLYAKMGEADSRFTDQRNSYKATMKNLFSLTSHESVLAQMIFCRFTEAYLNYLTDLLALMFQARPELLRSGEQERLDFILQYSSMEDLIRALAEKG